MNFIPWMVWPITTDLRHLCLTANNITAKLNNQFIRTGRRTFVWQRLFTWLWWWLPLRLSNVSHHYGQMSVSGLCSPHDQTIPSRILYHCFSYVRYDFGLCSLISTAPLGTIQYSVFKAIPVLLLLLSCLLSLSGQWSTRLSRLYWRHLWTFFFTSLISRHLWSAAMTTQS